MAESCTSNSSKTDGKRKEKRTKLKNHVLIKTPDGNLRTIKGSKRKLAKIANILFASDEETMALMKDQLVHTSCWEIPLERDLQISHREVPRQESPVKEQILEESVSCKMFVSDSSQLPEVVSPLPLPNFENTEQKSSTGNVQGFLGYSQLEEDIFEDVYSTLRVDIPVNSLTEDDQDPLRIEPSTSYAHFSPQSKKFVRNTSYDYSLTGLDAGELLKTRKTTDPQSSDSSEKSLQHPSTSKYVLSSDEDRQPEEPYPGDASSDEYLPDSSSEDDVQIPKTSKIRRNIFAPECKKKLFGSDEAVGDTTMSLRDTRSESRTSNNISTNVESTASLSTGTAATFSILLDSSKVFMNTSMLCHRATYKSDIVITDVKLIGVLYRETVSNIVHGHLCLQPPYGEQNKVHVVLVRKATRKEVTVKFEYCIPKCKLEGEEIDTCDGTYVSVLRAVPFEKIPSIVKGKYHCCFYCRKKFVEISSHLIKMHGSEAEINKILKMPQNTAERKQALRELRLRGDAQYNKSVQPDERIPLRKFSKTKVDTGVTCPICNALLACRNFARHERRCSKRPPNKRRVTAEARSVQEEKSTQSGMEELRDKCFYLLIKNLKKDVVLHEIVSDRCLKLTADRYALMHRNRLPALKNDRQNIRRLARILLAVKEIDPTIIDYEDLIIHSGDYELFMAGVFKVCGFQTDTSLFERPALAQVLQSVITFMLKSLNSDYRKHCGETSLECQKIENFESLHKANYGVYISRPAGRTRIELRARRKTDLPNSRDVKLLCQHINGQAEQAYNSLLERFNYESWMQLGKAELTKIIVFNRRRVTEVASMTIDLFEKRVALDDQRKQSLTVLERTLADQYMTMTLVGKRDHILNLLLDATQCRNLELFLKYRQDAGVDESNSFLFGIPTTALYIDASSVLREYSQKCGAENPHLLRTTYLRKQVATLAQLLSMNDNQIAQVARLMGHSQKIHEEVYRQDERLFQVTRWAKFLSIVNEDDLNKYKGKTFDEIANAAENMECNDNFENEEHVTVEELLNDDENVFPRPFVLEQMEHELETLEEHSDNPPLDSRSPQKQSLRRKVSSQAISSKKSPTKSPKKSPRKSPKKSPIKPTIASLMYQLRATGHQSAKGRKSFSSEELVLH